MSARKYDAVIFGASGYTGQFVVEEMARETKDDANFKWAVAGRDEKKLRKVLATASKMTGRNLDDVSVLTADVSNIASLHEMARQCRVVLNCVGPYYLYGEMVVNACVESGTHHLDISGEPYYLEKTQLDYDEKARAKGVFVVGACGFDSVPCEVGIQALEKEFDGDLNSVETYLEIKAAPGFTANIGTLHSAILGFGNSHLLKPVRQKLFPKPLPKSKHRIETRSLLFYSEDVRSWCLPFVGSDKSIVQRTQRRNYELYRKRPVQMNAYTVRSSLAHAVWTLLGAVFVVGFLFRFNWTRNLLKKYPSFLTFGLFSLDGPTREQISNSRFTMTVVGRGYGTKLAEPEDLHTDEQPDKKMIVRVDGREAGYDITPIALVQCAVVLLREADKLPREGGVYTAGTAFYRTTLIDRLVERDGLQISVVSRK